MPINQIFVRLHDDPNSSHYLTMDIDEALQELDLFGETEHPAPGWRWYKELIDVTSDEELRLYKANVAAGLGG